MPRAIYEFIYKDLKQKIEHNEFDYQELLPSENMLIQTYNCSRNTLRRAIRFLVMDGYVQTIQGKGVRNIYSLQNRQLSRSERSKVFRNLLPETAARLPQKFFYLPRLQLMRSSLLIQGSLSVHRFTIFSVFTF